MNEPQDTPTLVTVAAPLQTRIFASQAAAIRWAEAKWEIVAWDGPTVIAESPDGTVSPVGRVEPATISALFPRFRRDGGHIID